MHLKNGCEARYTGLHRLRDCNCICASLKHTIDTTQIQLKTLTKVQLFRQPPPSLIREVTHASGS
jgi:hypothetical protein